MRPFVFLVALLGVAIAGGARAQVYENCAVNAAPLSFTSDNQQQFTIKKNVTCAHALSAIGTIEFRGGGFNSRRFAYFQDLKVVSKPKHGFAGTTEGFRYLYRPDPNFVGTDSFVLSVTGESADGKGTSRITVDVTVTP